MSSFLRPATPAAASRGLGQFEVLAPLLTLATSGLGLYLEKEKQRKAALEADRARRLAEAQAATEAAAVQAATVAQQSQATQAQLQDMLGFGTVAQAAQSPTATYVLLAALAIGGAVLLRR